MNGLYLGCALARGTTAGDTLLALVIGLILGWLLSNAF